MRRASQRAIAIEAEHGAGFAGQRTVSAGIKARQLESRKLGASVGRPIVRYLGPVGVRRQCGRHIAALDPRMPGPTAAPAAAVSPILTDRPVEPGDGAASQAPNWTAYRADAIWALRRSSRPTPAAVAMNSPDSCNRLQRCCSALRFILPLRHRSAPIQRRCRRPRGRPRRWRIWLPALPGAGYGRRFPIRISSCATAVRCSGRFGLR
jgi:hypothetical protein